MLDQSKKAELLKQAASCRFCGCSTGLDLINVNELARGGVWCVTCHVCKARGPEVASFPVRAVEVWNTVPDVWFAVDAPPAPQPDMGQLVTVVLKDHAGGSEWQALGLKTGKMASSPWMLYRMTDMHHLNAALVDVVWWSPLPEMHREAEPEEQECTMHQFWEALTPAVRFKYCPSCGQPLMEEVEDG